jgi:hypothetical protein
VHVVSALKGAGLFNSYKLFTVFDYDTLTCHDGFQSTKHGRNSTEVTFPSQLITRMPLLSTDVQQTPKEDKTNLILRPKMST